MVTGKGVGTATVYAKADTVTRQITITVIDSATAAARARAAGSPGRIGRFVRQRDARRAARSSA